MSAGVLALIVVTLAGQPASGPPASGKAAPLFAEQLIARWTVDAPGANALVDVHNGAVLAAAGKKLVEYEPGTGAVTREHELPCAAIAIEQRYVLCERALLRANGDGALVEVKAFARRARAFAVHSPWVAVARDDGVFLLDEVNERPLKVAADRRVDGLAFGPGGARLYAVAEGAVYVEMIDAAKTPRVAETRRLVLDRGSARQGAEDGPFRARFGGATLDERARIPRLSLAAAEVIVDLRSVLRVQSVAAERSLLAVAEGRRVTLYTHASFGEAPPPLPPKPIPVDLPSVGMIGAAALIYVATPIAVAMLTDFDVVQTLAISGVGVLGSAAVVYGVIGLTAGTVFLWESTRPYQPIENDPLGGLLNAGGKACFEAGQVFLCVSGAALLLGGAALLGASPFIYMLYDPAAGLGDAQVDVAILASAGVGAGAGLLTWGLGFLPLEEDEDLIEAREIPREVLAIAVGTLAATTTWIVLRQTSFPR